MIVVADASVALKWFLRDAPGEDHQGLALELLQQAVEGQVQLWQPPHFVAEMAAVLARLKPAKVTASAAASTDWLTMRTEAVALVTPSSTTRLPPPPERVLP